MHTQPNIHMPPAPAIKIYTALLNQTGTNAPIPTILHNTIGNLVWSRWREGGYRADLNGAFPHDKTFIPMGSDYNGNGEILITLTDDTTILGYSTINWTTENRIGWNFYNPSWTPTDWDTIMGASNFPIEIRVYQ